MLLVRLASIVMGLFVSINALALDLREGDIYKGTIHLGKHPGEACFLKVQKEIVKGSERSFHLVMYKGNIKVGRSFMARSYETYMTAMGSSYLVKAKESQNKFTREENPYETLHVDLKNQQTVTGAIIFNQQQVIVNCKGMKLLSAR